MDEELSTKTENCICEIWEVEYEDDIESIRFFRKSEIKDNENRWYQHTKDIYNDKADVGDLIEIEGHGERNLRLNFDFLIINLAFAIIT